MRRPEEEGALTRIRTARRDSTPAERKLWHALRARQLNQAKFRRQVWLGPFIADFFCAEHKLIIEVDGHSHALQPDYDSRRTAWIERQGFRLVRVTNADVMHNIEGVLAYLASCLPSPSHSALPSGPLPLP